MMKTLGFACAIGILAGHAHADEKQEAAVAAAKQWLSWVDAGDYGKSWREAAPFLKKTVTEEQWEKMIAAVRGAFGKVESRKLVSAERKTSLPGAPDGEYVVIRFETSFAEKHDSVETITPMKVDGDWRVSGYFIK